MIKHLRALCALAAALLLAPTWAQAQATSTNTLPRGIYSPAQTTQTQAQPVVIVTIDSVSGLPCLVGWAATCAISSTGGGGGGAGTEFAEDAAHSSGALGTLSLGVRRDTAASSSGTTGDYSTLNLDSTGRLWVNASNLDAVLATIDTSLNDIETASEDTTPVPVKGGTAVDAALSDPPVVAGCRASSAAPAAVSADNEVQTLRCDLNGNLIARMAPLENGVSGVITSAMTGTTSTSLVAAPGASLRNYITEISCVNTHASVDTLVNVQDGSGGTVIAQLATKAAYGGHQKSFPAPLRQPTANTALFVVNVITGASTTCSASGFKAP